MESEKLTEIRKEEGGDGQISLYIHIYVLYVKKSSISSAVAVSIQVCEESAAAVPRAVAG